MQHPHACSVGLVNGDYVFLILRAFEPFAKTWTFPGGKCKSGEKALACAVRELHEEIGLEIEDPVFVVQQNLGTDEKPFYLSVFAAEHKDFVAITNDEIAEYSWVHKDEVTKLKTTDGLDAVVMQCLSALHA